MIEFSGTVSEKCHEDRMKRVNKKWFIISVIGFVFVAIYTAFLGILHNEEFYLFLIITIGLAIFTIFEALPLPKKIRNRFLHLKITIKLNEEMISRQDQYSYTEEPITKVKKIIDMGDWYYIIFKLGDLSNCWVCQKDWIIQGTIEDFEKIFAGKIIIQKQ